MSLSRESPQVIPSVDRLLRLPGVVRLAQTHGRALVLESVRTLLDAVRAGDRVVAGRDAGFDEAVFEDSLARHLETVDRPSQRRVINLTGTVLHTNLGRALLPAEAVEAVTIALREPTNLEYDVDRGARGERDRHVERWLTRLTGAQAATVVNNNAAAVLLTLSTLAARKEVIVSRGELVEIGGAFRIPDIMARAGCRLVEVGTTNRTHLRDFAEAIGPRTAAIMKVHASNYAIQGFTASVPEEQLANLAHEHGLPYISDLGSGMLVNLEDYGLPHEPTAKETLARGADIVTFSGDKLLGGPQAGLIVGRTDLVQRIMRNPLKRALRMDKLRLAALEAVLRLYLDPDRLRERLPTIALLTRPIEEIRKLAEAVLPDTRSALQGHAEVTLVDCRSQIGSGSLPVDLLPSVALAMRPAGSGKRSGRAVEQLAAAFRALPVPVIGRINEGSLLFDLRTLDEPQAFLRQLSLLAYPPASPPPAARKS